MVVYHAFSQYLVFVFFMFSFHIPFHSHLPPLAFNLFFLLFKLLTVNIITTKIVGTIKLLQVDALLSPLLNPLEGPTMQSCGKLGLEGHSQLLALKRGRGACYKSRDQTRKRDQIIKLESASKTNHKRVSLHSGTPLGVGTRHGHFDTQDSPRPGLGGSHHLPHVVFSVLLRGGYIQMALFPGTPKLESRNCPGLDSRDFGHSQLLALTSDWSEV